PRSGARHPPRRGAGTSVRVRWPFQGLPYLHALEDVQHLSVEGGVGPEEIAAADVDRAALEIRHFGARLLQDHDARGHVPGAQAHLPESVEGAGGGPAEIERRGAHPADRLRLHEELAEIAQVLLP